MPSPTEFLQEHAPDGVLSPQAAANLIELVQRGETDAASSDTGTAPADATAAAAEATTAQAETNAAKTTPAPAPAPAAEEVDPAKAVVLAKDGVHTIPYSKLTEAREGEKHWRAQAETAQQELTALKAQAQQRVDAGAAPTQTDTNVATATAAIDKGVDPAIFGDFSEADIAKGVAKLHALISQQVLAAVKADLAPLQQTAALTEQQAHAQAIYAVHPDADSLVESKELQDWIGKQPSFVRSGFEAVLEKGTAGQVNELFTAFKAATATTQPPAASTPDVKAQAIAAVTAVAKAAPTSLSDIPGGRAGGQSFQELMAEKSGPELLDAFEGMTKAQIEAYLNRQM